MSEALTLKVDTGAVDVDIEDKGEVIGTFRFNPTDVDIIARYEKVVSTIENLSTPDDFEYEDIVKISDTIKEQFNYLLNYKVSDALFAKCNPLTPVTNGDFFFETVLDGLAGIIENTMQARIKKKQARIKRATSKYHK